MVAAGVRKQPKKAKHVFHNIKREAQTKKLKHGFRILNDTKKCQKEL